MSAAGWHTRPRRSWFWLPLPLAVVFAVVMPWVAVRDARQLRRAFRQLCDILLLASRQRDQFAARLRSQGAAPEPERRHLHLVR